MTGEMHEPLNYGAKLPVNKPCERKAFFLGRVGKKG